MYTSLRPSSIAHSLQIHYFWAPWTRTPYLLGLGPKLWPYNWRRLWEELVPQQVQPLEMKGSGLRQMGRTDSQQQDNFLNLERERDQDKRREGSVNTSHMSRSRSKGKGHASQKRDDNRALQQEINDLKRKLRRAQRRRPSPNPDTSDEEDNEYKQRSRIPPSETFSYKEEQPHKRSHKSPSYKGLANDAMSKALDRISQSPFTCKIEGAELPRRFH